MQIIALTFFSVTLLFGGALMFVASTGEDKPRLLLASKVLSAISGLAIAFLYL